MLVPAALQNADTPRAPQVVDEADRLLTQSFHDWLPTVLSALKPSFSAAALAEKENDADPTGGRRRERKTKARAAGGLKEADALAPAWWDAEGKPGRVASDVDERCHGSVSPPSRLVSFRLAMLSHARSH